MLLQKYFDTFPKIKAWHLQIQQRLGKSRTMITPIGRKRTFFGLWGDQLFREAYAFVPQSTVADVLNLAMIRFADMVTDVEAELMLQIHDAFVVQCYEEFILQTVKKLKEAFAIPIYINGRTFTIPVEMKMGRNWQDMQPIK